MLIEYRKRLIRKLDSNNTIYFLERSFRVPRSILNINEYCSTTNKDRKRGITNLHVIDTSVKLEIGNRIRSKLNSESGWEWYVGTVLDIGRSLEGEIVKISIEYDGGRVIIVEYEARDWHDDDNVVVNDSGENKEGKDDKRRRKGEVVIDSSGMLICGEAGCEYKSKLKENLNRHKASAHDMDGTLYLCNVKGCAYKVKQKSQLKRHKAMIHDIDVNYYLCNVDGCKTRRK